MNNPAEYFTKEFFDIFNRNTMMSIILDSFVKVNKKISNDNKVKVIISGGFIQRLYWENNEEGDIDIYTSLDNIKNIGSTLLSTKLFKETAPKTAPSGFPVVNLRHINSKKTIQILNSDNLDSFDIDVCSPQLDISHIFYGPEQGSSLSYRRWPTEKDLIISEGAAENILSKQARLIRKNFSDKTYCRILKYIDQKYRFTPDDLEFAKLKNEEIKAGNENQDDDL